MKQLYKMSLFLVLLFISSLFTACDNPLFINAVGLYKVEFSTNGGSSIESYRTDKIKELPYTSKPECTFAGWYLNSDFSGEPLTFPLDIKRDTTLYAKWLQQFTVTFETNGGDEIASYKTGLIETSPDTSRTNYIFAGWYLKSDFSGEPVVFPYTVTKPTTFYAKWIATYNVSFETNGGSVISSYRTAEIESAPITIRDGFTFMGWYKDSAFSQRIEFPYTLLEDVTLYAKWQQNFTVTFVTNGGNSIAPLITGYIETAPVCTKADASLECWYLTEDFVDVTKVLFPYSVTSDITLYAKWQPVQCTITYFANGATSGTVPESVTVNKGSTYAVAGNTGNLEKTGYAFTKWATTSNGDGGASYSAGQSITVSSDINLYAQWGKDYAAMITVQGGSFYFGDPSDSARPRINLSSFQIAQYELTYELWLEVYTWAKDHGYNLTSAKKGYATNDKYKSFVPATYISWNMACVWLNAYSEYNGFEPVYYSGASIWKDDTNTSNTFSWNKSKNGYRLPTECEWEFAAGGGSEAEHDRYKYAGSNTLGEVAWYYVNSGKEANPVGLKKANLLNLYDMSGNVSEWCYDSKDDFGTGNLTNPIHDSSSSSRVYRGGTLFTSYHFMNISFRESRGKDYTYHDGYYKETNNGYSYSQSIGAGLRIARNAD